MITLKNLKDWKACSDAIKVLTESGRTRFSEAEAIAWCREHDHQNWIVWLTGTPAVKRMLAAGAKVNARDNVDWTPLHCAIWSGYADVCQVLKDAGGID